MMPKIFINLSKETYFALEQKRYDAGEVFDYPASELDDLLTGKVGDTEQALYARYVDDDGEVRFGEVKEFIYRNDAEGFYALAETPRHKIVDVYAEGLGEKDNCEDVGALMDAAYKAFKTGKYKDVTVYACHGPNDFVDIVTFE